MNEHQVIIYTSDNCPECEDLVDLLNEWKIEFTEKSVSNNNSTLKEMQARGIYGTPVTFIDDNPVLGYQEIKLKYELGISNSQGSYFRNVYEDYDK
ncbi:glutaredoxin family protein [Virgibacillus flavescens]|uniref:glutaredoxin family protein n=1 Tax=Virgibacillus flavescens TaxID=1611422 RepID=UPI003D33FE3C